VAARFSATDPDSPILVYYEYLVTAGGKAAVALTNYFHVAPKLKK
jgi:hypothetical protein